MSVLTCAENAERGFDITVAYLLQPLHPENATGFIDM